MTAAIEEQIKNVEVGKELIIHFPFGGLQIGSTIGFNRKDFEILKVLEGKKFLLKRIS